MKSNHHTTFEDAKSVLTILIAAGFDSRFAGGCVRDRLMNQTPKDYDIASAALPTEVMNLFAARQFRVIPTGIDHGTVTVMTASGPVEVTTLREDVATDGRHAVVAFNGATFETDAARRDFTINAMFEDGNGKIYDYFGGMEDLRARTLRFVGNAGDRVREDYLRALRYFRFWARFGFHPDPEAIEAIKGSRQHLAHLSRERVSAELRKILTAEHAVEVLGPMETCGVTAVLWPEFVRIDHKLSIALTSIQSMPEDLKFFLSITLLTGLVSSGQWDDASIKRFCRHQKWSDADAKTLAAIHGGWQTLKTPLTSVAAGLEFADSVDSVVQGRNLEQFYGPVWHCLARFAGDTSRMSTLAWILANDQAFGFRRHAHMPINGHDAREAFPDLKGHEIGVVMRQVKTAFLDGEWQSRPEGLGFLRNITRIADSSEEWEEQE